MELIDVWQKRKMYTLMVISGVTQQILQKVVHDFVIYENDIGIGYCKLNASLWKWDDYMCQIKLINKYVSSSGGWSMDKWESLKHYIKDLPIAYSVKRPKTCEKYYLDEIESFPYHLIDMNKTRNLENLLENLYDKKINKGTYSLKGNMGQWGWKK